MSRTLFIGDSHTCGYKTVPGEQGLGSYSIWNENSYVEEYSKLHNKEAVVYSMPGANTTSYADWMGNMFNLYDDIDEVIILLSSLNRFIIGYNEFMTPDTIPMDTFLYHEGTNKNGMVNRYLDKIIAGDKDQYLQLYQKPHEGDYDKFTGIGFSYEEGLTNPDLRKNTYMEIKTFFELNTHLEQRAFFKDVYTWDNMCADRNIPLYLFKMRERTFYPNTLDFYGKLKATTVADKSVEEYFNQKNIFHTTYFEEDKEHFNQSYHKLIAEKFLKHLTKPK